MNANIQQAYIAALDALEVISNCRPGRCEMTAVQRAEVKTAKVADVMFFLKKKTKNAEWVAKQDAVLVSLGDLV